MAIPLHISHAFVPKKELFICKVTYTRTVYIRL